MHQDKTITQTLKEQYFQVKRWKYLSCGKKNCHYFFFCNFDKMHGKWVPL